MATEGQGTDTMTAKTDLQTLRVYIPRPLNRVLAKTREEPPKYVFLPPEDNLIRDRALIKRYIRQQQIEKQRKLKKRMKAAEEIEIHRQVALLEVLPPELQEQRDEKRLKFEFEDDKINIGNLQIGYQDAAQVIKAWIMMDED